MWLWHLEEVSEDQNLKFSFGKIITFKPSNESFNHKVFLKHFKLFNLNKIEFIFDMTYQNFSFFISSSKMELKGPQQTMQVKGGRKSGHFVEIIFR